MADYATTVMCYLADKDRAINASNIAESTDIQLPSVKKVLKQLQQHGLLVSSRGAEGGYSLAKTSFSTNLTEIIEAIDGPLALADCCLPKNCSRSTNCHTSNNWQTINQVIKTSLSRINLQQMTGNLSANLLTIPIVEEKA